MSHHDHENKCALFDLKDGGAELGAERAIWRWPENKKKAVMIISNWVERFKMPSGIESHIRIRKVGREREGEGEYTPSSRALPPARNLQTVYSRCCFPPFIDYIDTVFDVAQREELSRRGVTSTRI